MMCAVYRYRNAAGDLLYIGASSWPVDRIKQHYWERCDELKEVVTVQIEWFETREDARKAEVAAIKAERPQWNLASRDAAA
jgi:predicted GIY-YIG superfamily endonuclease